MRSAVNAQRGRGKVYRASRSLALALSLIAIAALGTSCRSPGGRPVKACVQFSASPNLNLYDGQPHPITIFIFPLESTAGFTQANVRELLTRPPPQGALSKPLPLTISPGEQKRRFEESLPGQTQKLGIVADYYRASGDPEGSRTLVVPARCGMRTPKLILSPKDLYAK